MKNIRLFIPILFTFFVIAFYYFKRIVFFKYYPPIVDLSIFLIFFVSLFQKETIIQKFARMINNNLCELELVYTKNLTYVWCCFLFINFLIAVVSVFLSDRFWLLYNGFISYLLTGLLFIIEYIVRIIFRKKNNI